MCCSRQKQRRDFSNKQRRLIQCFHVKRKRSSGMSMVNLSSKLFVTLMLTVALILLAGFAFVLFSAHDKFVSMQTYSVSVQEAQFSRLKPDLVPKVTFREMLWQNYTAAFCRHQQPSRMTVFLTGHSMLPLTDRCTVMVICMACFALLLQGRILPC